MPVSIKSFERSTLGWVGEDVQKPLPPGVDLQPYCRLLKKGRRFVCGGGGRGSWWCCYREVGAAHVGWVS